MIIEQTATGATVEEAKENALQALGLELDTEVEYDFEIIDLPQKKALGLFGGNPAKVRVFREVADAEYKEYEAVGAPDAKKEKKAKPEKKAKKEAAELSGKVNPETVKTVTEYLNNVLTLMGVEEFEIVPAESEDGLTLNIEGEKLGVIIGRKGETIDALQHLTSLVANRGKNDYCRITLNPGEYREKRESVLVGVAERSAQKAEKTRRNVVLEPMNSYERRIIHNAVQPIEGIESWSVGEGDHRRVVIGSKEFTASANNDRRDRRNDRGRGRGGRGRDARRDNTIHAEPTRDPIKDSAGPLYGVIKPQSAEE